jgi:hypothetical protein
VSRHHMLPPIIYTPEPPKPKKAERRRGVGTIKGKGGVDEADETEETGEVSGFGAPARAAAPPPKNPSTSVEAAERRIPSTTGKLSESTLTELLQMQEQEIVPGIDGVVPLVKP